VANTDPEQPVNTRPSGFAQRLGKEEAKTRYILFVDDHNLFREVLALLLDRNAHLGNVQTGSAYEARQVLRNSANYEFALAVVDLDLPDEDNFELIGELHRAGVPVLALTKDRAPDLLARVSGSGEMMTTAASCDEILVTARRLVSN
jgi:DNA-binding NarL/FixJ family response regulator